MRVNVALSQKAYPVFLVNFDVSHSSNYSAVLLFFFSRNPLRLAKWRDLLLPEGILANT